MVICRLCDPSVSTQKKSEVENSNLTMATTLAAAVYLNTVLAGHSSEGAETPQLSTTDKRAVIDGLQDGTIIAKLAEITQSILHDHIPNEWKSAELVGDEENNSQSSEEQEFRKLSRKITKSLAALESIGCKISVNTVQDFLDKK